MAAYGSYTTEIDTIDLRSASDSVHVELIRAIMPRIPRMWLLGTRTKKVVLPDRSVVGVKKFAPMGSALCFVTQCLVFTAMSLLAGIHEAEGLVIGDETRVRDEWFHNSGDKLLGLFSSVPGYHYASRKGAATRFQPLAVYGDDIAVDTRLTQRLVHLLGRLGFSVNEEKSFVGGQAFRESCGGFYHDGQDVTPLRFKVKRGDNGQKAERVASMVALANRAGDYGYRNLRSLLIHRVLELSRGIAFTQDRDAGLKLYSHKPRNTHLRRKYHRDYQLDGYRCTVLRQLESDESRIQDYEADAYYRYKYVQWWAGTKPGRTELDEGRVRRYRPTDSLELIPFDWKVRDKFKLGWGWMPAE